MKTFSAKPADVTRQWYILDASETPLGRLATVASRLLMGKDKVSVTPHVDSGDYVIVINAGKLVVSANKLQTKVYWRYSGFPGGIKKRTLAESQELDPTYAITHAIRGMLPVNKLRDGRLARLKVYSGNDYNHSAQKPQTLSLTSKGKK
ncbi:50S ribosomal protein L13 [Candidatus Saccharibacteria bacterium]|nr:50S ribosomal protein L13 [Candidatus Saccharibacteria bacterium]